MTGHWYDWSHLIYALPGALALVMMLVIGLGAREGDAPPDPRIRKAGLLPNPDRWYRSALLGAQAVVGIVLWTIVLYLPGPWPILAGMSAVALCIVALLVGRASKGRCLPSLFAQLQDEFRLACEAPRHNETSCEKRMRDEATKIIKGILEQHDRGEATLEDARRLKAALLWVIPDQCLPRQREELIREYHAAVGEEGVRAIPPPALDRDAKVRREALVDFATDVNEHVLALERRWRLRTKLSVTNVGILLLAAVTLGWVMYIPADLHRPWLFPFWVFLTGVMGGAISTQQRIFKNEATEERWILAFSDGGWEYWSILMSPLMGGIGALIILAASQTPVLQQLFKGSVLAHLPRKSIQWLPSLGYILNTPGLPGAVAKLFLISLAAGYSERLVPDVLDLSSTLGS